MWHGIPMWGGGGIPVTGGNIYWVNPTTGIDTNIGTSKVKPVETLAEAVDRVTTDNHDIILMSAAATHSVTEMITLSKSRVHIIGLDGATRRFGQRAKLSMGVTTAATDLAVLKNTGVGNTFTNLKFMSSNTKEQSLYSVIEAGEYAEYNGCEIYKSSLLDGDAVAELVLNGDSAQFNGCTIGSLANFITATGVRANILLTGAIGGEGKVMRDCVFSDCLIWRNSGHTANRFVWAPAAADVERLLLFERTGFINAVNAVADPAECVDAGAALTAGNIILDPLCYCANATKLATQTGILVTGPAPAAGQGIAVNAA